MWQNPYVNICKRARIGQSWKDIKKDGNAFFVMDQSVKAWTISVQGNVPSTNFIRFPKSDSASLNLSGQYLYLEISAVKSKNFKMYLEVNTTNKFTLRFSISNMHKKTAVRGYTSLVPFNVSNRRWMVLAIDIPAMIATHGPQGFDESHYLCIKSLQICAQMKVRHLFSSSNLYDSKSVPKELALPVSKSQKWEELYAWRWLPEKPSLGEKGIASPSPSKTLSRTHQLESPGKKSPLGLSNRDMTSHKRHYATKSALAETDATTGGAKVALSRAADLLAREGKIRSTPNKPKHRSPNSGRKAPGSPFDVVIRRQKHRDIAQASNILERAGLGRDPDEVPVSSFYDQSANSFVSPGSKALENAHKDFSTSAESIKPDMTYQTFLDETAAAATAEGEETEVPPAAPEPTLRPDPIMTLETVVGFSGDSPNSMIWSPDGTFMIFPCEALIAIMKVEETQDSAQNPLRQSVLHGHTANIAALALNHAGTLLASAQVGKQPMIRLWEIQEPTNEVLPPTANCIAILTAHGSDLTSLAFSGDDHLLCAAGKDQHHRMQLVVWDITDATMEKNPRDKRNNVGNNAPYPIVARQISEFPVAKLKFSPYEPRRLVSCGRENIRFWRIKNGLLRGLPVILNEYARDTVFTDFAFESSYAPKPFQGAVQKRVFVATKAGTVVQVNYESHDLECVYRLHDKAIHSIAINEGFCVTGSADKFLRVWPLDFSDYFLEAEHEGPVMSVAISVDGLKLAIGTSTGTLGTLDVASHMYKTLLRSHAGKVHACAVDPHPGRNEFITVSGDGTIRVWSADSQEQLFEFDAPGDHSYCLAYQPSSDPAVRKFACGFNSGCIRVFDIPNTRMTHEYQQHDGAVAQIVFDPVNGKRLYSAGRDGNICVYDVARDYQPVKMVASDTIPLHVSMSINSDGTLLASVAPDSTFCIIFRADSLMPIRKIRRDQKKHSVKDRFDHQSTGITPKSGFHAVQFSPSGKELLVSTTDSRLVRYNPYTGDILSQTGKVHGGLVSSIAYSPNGHYIVTAGEDKAMKVWERGLHGGSLPRFQSFVGHSESINTVGFFRNNGGGAMKVISVANERGILMWDFHGFKEFDGDKGEDDEDEKATGRRGYKSRTSTAPIDQALGRVIKKIKKIGHLVSMSITRMSSALSELEPPGQARKHVDAFRKAISRLQFNLDDEDMQIICLYFSSDHPGFVDTEAFLQELRKRAAGPYQSRLAFDKARAKGADVVIGSNARPATAPKEESSYMEKSQAQFSFSASAIDLDEEDSRLDSTAAVPAPPPEPFEGKLSTILGYQGIGGGSARSNVLWDPESGLFGFSCGRSIVFEDLVPQTEDMNTRRQTHIFGPEREIQRLCISMHATYMAAAEMPEGRTGTVSVWNCDGAFLNKFRHSHGALQDLQFASDDTLLIGVGSLMSPVITIWQVTDGTILSSYCCSPGAPLVSAIVPIYDENRVHFLSVGRRAVQEWHLVEDENMSSILTCHSVFELPGIDVGVGRTEYFTCLSAKPDGDDHWAVAVGGHFGTVWHFSSSTYSTGAGSRMKFSLNGMWSALEGSVEYLAVQPSTDHVIVAGMSRNVAIWSAGPDINPTLTTSICLDGRVVSMTWDDTVKDAIVGTDVGSIWCLRRSANKVSAVPMARSHSAPVKALAASENGVLLASAGGDDGSVRVWQTQLMQDVLVLPHDSEEGSCNAVSMSVVSSEGGTRLLAAGYTDGTIRQYDLSNIFLPDGDSSIEKNKKNSKAHRAFADILISKRRQPHRSAVTALEYVTAFKRFNHTNGQSKSIKNVLISGSSNGDVVLNINHGTVVRELSTSHRGSRITCIERSPFDPALFLIASNNTNITIWRCDVALSDQSDVQFEELSALTLGSRTKRQKAKDEPNRPTLACFSPVDASVVLCTTDQKPPLVAFYCFSTKKFLRTITLPHWHFATSLAAYVDLSSSKAYIAAGLNTGKIVLVNYHTEQTADMNDVDVAMEKGNVKALVFCSSQSTLVSTCESNLLCWSF